MSDRQDKRAQFEQGGKKSPAGKIAVVVVAVVAIAVGAWAYMGGTAGSGKYPQPASSQGMLTIPVSEVGDGKAHFFSMANGETSINFFVVKSNDGVIRAAFDTCDVCYREQKGYRQEGDVMVCNNCDQKFHTNMINDVKGGCNPAPLKRAVRDGQVLIAAADLFQGTWYFKGQAKQ